MRLYISYAFILCFLTLPHLLDARNLDTTKRVSQYIMQQYDADNGLPSASLATMTQCSNQDLWIGTYSGLVRYDGSRFQSYNIENTPELGSNSITAICERDHELWIGSHIGITRYQNHKFYRDHALSELNRFNIERFFQDSKNNLWISTVSNGLFLYDGQKVTLIKESLQIKTPIRTFVETPNGQIWLATEKGEIYTKQGDKFFLKHSEAETGGDPYLMLASNGTLWVAAGKGVFTLSPHGLQPVEGLGSVGYSRYLIEDKFQHIWIASRNGLFCFSPKTGKLDGFLVKQGFPKADVLNMMFDHQGSLWVLTYRSGLLQFTDGIFTTYGNHEGLDEGIVTSVVEISPDRFWIGMEQGKIHEISNGLVNNWQPKSPLPNQRLKHLMKDSKGFIWVSTYGGLRKFDATGRNLSYQHQNKIDDFARYTFEDSKGNIWVATSRRGVYKIGADGSFLHLTSRNGLASNFILSIDEDKDGKIWVGTKNGICIIDNNQVTTTLQMQDGLPSNFVFDLYIDSEGLIWIATELGLCRYDGEDFFLFNFPNIKNDVAIFDVVEDKKGYLWLSSGSGLVYVRKEELNKRSQETSHKLHYRLFTKSDGLKSEQCVGAVKMLFDSQDRLWVPTTAGMSIIQPNKISYVPQLTTPSIAQIKTSDSIFYADQSISLPSGSGKRLEFLFSCYDFTAAEKNIFRYKLEPFEEEWRLLEGGYKISYTNLGGKDYNFKMQMGDGIGNWSETAEYKFSIAPKFIETYWYYASLILGGLLLGFIIHQSTQRVRKANERELQKRVSERTREVMEQKQQIEAQKQELEATLENLKSTQTQLVQSEKMASLGQLTAGIAHEINNPINFITGGVEALTVALKEVGEVLEIYHRLDSTQSEEELQIIQTEIKKLKSDLAYDELLIDIKQMLQDVKSGAHRTAEIVLGLRNFSRSDETKASPVNLHECIDATLTILRNQYKHNIKIIKEYDSELPMVTCRAGQINQVLMNLLANAMQAIQEKGNILIKTFAKDDFALIEIQDNGSGISKDILNKIFDPFFTTKPIGKGTGLGLSISHGIIRDHQGEIMVDSQQGIGTTFTIKLPLHSQLKSV